MGPKVIDLVLELYRSEQVGEYGDENPFFVTYQCNQVNIYSFNPVTSYLVGAGIYLILFLIVQGIRRIVKAKNNARSTSDRTEISDEGKEACAV